MFGIREVLKRVLSVTLALVVGLSMVAPLSTQSAYASEWDYDYDDYYDDDYDDYDDYDDFDWYDVPDVPYDFTVKRDTFSSLSLSWEDSYDASGYEIYRYNESLDKYQLVKTLAGEYTTSWKDTNLSSGKLYKYRIRAYNGNKTSEYSSTVSQVTLPANWSGPTATVRAMGKKSIKVSWNKLSNVSGYSIYRYNSYSGSYSLVKDVYGESVTSWTDTGLTSGKAYTYRVKGFKTINGTNYHTNYSNNAKGTTFTSIWKRTPSSLKATVISTNSVKLSWNKIKDAKGYVIYRYNSSKNKYVAVKTIKSGSTTSWKDTKLKKGKKYKYRFKAYKVNGIKAYTYYSNTVSATPRGNVWIGHPDLTMYDSDYGNVLLEGKKVYYNSKGQLVYDCYILNNRIFYAEKYKWIRVKIYDGSTLIANQKFTNKWIGLDGYDYKRTKFVFTTGTRVKNHNLRNASISDYWTYYYYYNY